MGVTDEPNEWAKHLRSPTCERQVFEIGPKNFSVPEGERLTWQAEHDEGVVRTHTSNYEEISRREECEPEIPMWLLSAMSFAVTSAAGVLVAETIHQLWEMLSG
jgi:hypothetical protein